MSRVYPNACFHSTRCSKNDEKVLVSKKLIQQFEEINKALDKCCELALQQPVPNKQIALMTNASFARVYPNACFHSTRCSKSDEKVVVSKELVQQFEEIIKALDKCCDLALQQPVPNKQIALMTNASFAAAENALVIEDVPNHRFSSLLKSYAPVA